MPKQKPTTIDEYIADFPEGTQAMLEELRATIMYQVPVRR